MKFRALKEKTQGTKSQGTKAHGGTVKKRNPGAGTHRGPTVANGTLHHPQKERKWPPCCITNTGYITGQI